MNASSTQPSGVPTPEQIAARAYAIWEGEGRPQGRDMEHWFQAEMLLKADRLQNPPSIREAVAASLAASKDHSAPPLRKNGPKGRTNSRMKMEAA